MMFQLIECFFLGFPGEIYKSVKHFKLFVVIRLHISVPRHSSYAILLYDNNYKKFGFMQRRVRCFALYRNKPHVPPLTSSTANPFEFKPCDFTPQAGCYAFAIAELDTHSYAPFVDGVDYRGI